MPTTASRHPSNIALAEYALGKLEADAAETVHNHLTLCDDCRTVVEKTPSDTLVALLRKAHRSETLAAPTPPRGSTAVQFPGRIPELDISGLPPELRDHPRYRIVRLLGRGGMGVVYKAEHKVMERTVAIKVINASLLGDAEAVERFQREVKAAAKLEHPNIVRAYDAEQAGELQLLAMEYVEGKSLADVVDAKGALPIGYACQCIRQAALGLQQAFEHGMVHRDIKPHNLILSSKGVVKILDFGLAKLVSERKTHGGLTAKDMVMGTPDYMAPEQARDCRSADVRADIYSLGCTLYCLLTGRPPFTGGNALELVMKQVHDVPRPVDELRPEVPAELSALVSKMLAKDPAQRPQTPKEVADALLTFNKPQAASLVGKKQPESAFAGLRASPSPRTTPFRPSKRMWIAAGVGFAALAAIVLTIILIKTPEGYVELDVPDNTEVRVGKELIAVKLPDSGPIQVKVNKDKKTVTVVKDGVEVESRDLTLNDKGKTVRVGWRSSSGQKVPPPDASQSTNPRFDVNVQAQSPPTQAPKPNLAFEGVQPNTRWIGSKSNDPNAGIPKGSHNTLILEVTERSGSTFSGRILILPSSDDVKASIGQREYPVKGEFGNDEIRFHAKGTDQFDQTFVGAVIGRKMVLTIQGISISGETVKGVAQLEIQESRLTEVKPEAPVPTKSTEAKDQITAPEEKPSGAVLPQADPVQPNTRWVGTRISEASTANPGGFVMPIVLEVIERNGNSFSGRLNLDKLSGGRSYTCQGEISNGKIRFSTEKSGKFEQTYEGSINGHKMELTFQGAGTKGEFVKGKASLDRDQASDTTPRREQEPRTEDHLQPNTRWTGMKLTASTSDGKTSNFAITLELKARSGPQISGKIVIRGTRTREYDFTGEIAKGQIHFRARGSDGFDQSFSGTVTGTKMRLTFEGIGNDGRNGVRGSAHLEKQ